MITPLIPENEIQRLDKLRALGLLDTAPSDRLDRVTRLASAILEVPIALITLVDAQRQWFKSRVGLEVAETSREVSFCGHAILGDELFEIADATKDPRFHDNPLVTGGPEIRFYAGRPLTAPGGEKVGTLCVIDRKPRRLSDAQRTALEDLAALVEDELAAAFLQKEVSGVLAAGKNNAEARLKAVIDCAVRTSIISCDLEGRIVLFSRGAEKMLGWSAREMLGRSPAEFHLKEEVEARGAELSRELGLPVSGFQVFVEQARTAGFDAREWTYVRRDGTRLTVDLTVTPVRDEAGAITGYLGIAEDVTDRKAEEAMRSQVIHHVNHELRTPLNVLTLGLSMLEEDVRGKLPPADERYLQLACEGATHLKKMVSDLLDVARSESGKLSVTPESFDLAAAASSVVDGFRPLAAERGVNLSVAGADSPRPVYADPTRVRQILSNLLDNALKFTPKGGAVSLRLEADERPGWARAVVADDGPGMSAEDAARVFDRLYQTANKAGKGQAGLGLGLFIAKELAARQGGRLTLETEKGRGCRFTLVLPTAA